MRGGEGSVVTELQIFSIESRIPYAATLSDPFGATSPRGGGVGSTHKKAPPQGSLARAYSAVNGRSAMLRARLIATVTWR